MPALTEILNKASAKGVAMRHESLWELADDLRDLEDELAARLFASEETYQPLAGISVHGASLSAIGLADMALYQRKAISNPATTIIFGLQDINGP
jgi:hypothetical protein